MLEEMTSYQGMHNARLTLMSRLASAASTACSRQVESLPSPHWKLRLQSSHDATPCMRAMLYYASQHMGRANDVSDPSNKLTLAARSAGKHSCSTYATCISHT